MNEFDRLTQKRNEAKEKKKKMLLTGITICIITILVLAVMILYYQRLDARTFKLFVNDVQSQISDGFYFKNDKGETYVRAKDIANFIGWSYQNGEYGSFTEDLNSGYIQNEYEIASFVAGSNILKKYIQVTATEYTDETGQVIEPYEANSENGTLETSTLELPIISQDGQIYFPLKNLSDICNCRVNYDNEYRMYIYDQKFLVNLAQVKAAEYGYQSVSGIYENMRALGYGMMCVSNGSMYGVVNIDTGANILGLKYNDMVFAQNVKEFFVKTVTGDEETIGIINLNGNTVVQPKNYDNLQILSDSLGLYLVEKDGKYGVLSREGEVVVECEYDSIGLPEDVINDFNFSIETNKYILYDNSIVIEVDGKYGLYDIDGDLTLQPGFEGFGYVAKDDDNSERSFEDTLTIEFRDLKCSDGITRDVKAIVLKYIDGDGNIKYGLYDAESKMEIYAACDRIYGVTDKGETKYYFGVGKQSFNLKDDMVQAASEIFYSR